MGWGEDKIDVVRRQGRIWRGKRKEKPQPQSFENRIGRADEANWLAAALITAFVETGASYRLSLSPVASPNIDCWT